jgi:choline-glycine betaine transporter
VRVNIVIIAAILLGFSFGLTFGQSRAEKVLHLPRTNPVPRWIGPVLFFVAVVLSFPRSGSAGADQGARILTALVMPTLLFLVVYAISATLSFVATKRSAKKRPSN